MDKNQSKSAGLPRREFLKKTATATAAAVATTSLFKTPVYGQNQAPSTGRAIGANDRITIGYIGVGGKPSNCPGMGAGHIGMQKAKAADLNINQAAVCDLWEVRNANAKQAIGTSDVQTYTEYRKVLDRKDIDAVLIATHDVWHAPISIQAMEAGKHVYCEKPMTRYLDEAFKVAEVVKRTGRVFQIGSQGTSAEGWHKAADIIKSGKLGKLVWARGAYLRNNPTGEWNYSISPGAENIDWKTYVGQAKNVPAKFDPEHFFRWRKFFPYCSGLLGDLVPHRLHPLMLATGNPEFPKRVVCIGTHSIHSDKAGGAYERDVPEYIQLEAEFPSGFLLSINSSSVSGKVPGFSIFGQDATLDVTDSGNALEMNPERHKADELDAISIKGLQHEDQVVHAKNWLDSIRTGQMPNGNIDLALKCQTVISLAEMSDRLGIVCFFDEKTHTIKDGSGKEVKPISYGTVEKS